MLKNPLSVHGLLASALPVTSGRYLFVCAPADAFLQTLQELFPVTHDGKVSVYTSLESAYAAATTNVDDVIVLCGNGTHTISSALDWSKSRIHVVSLGHLLGLDRSVQQEAKVQFALGTEALAYILKCTGTRNTFQGVKFIQNSTNAAALTVAQFAGEGNLYEDCSFLFGVADNLDQADAYEAVLGEDAGTFRRCSFGTDVLVTSAARTVMAIDAVTGASSADGAKSNRFYDCEWIISTSQANATLVKLIDTAGAKFLNRFVNPAFLSTINGTTSSVLCTNAFASASGYVEGNFILEFPRTVCTNTCAGVTDNVKVIAPAASNNAHEAVVPA